MSSSSNKEPTQPDPSPEAVPEVTEEIEAACLGLQDRLEEEYGHIMSPLQIERRVQSLRRSLRRVQAASAGTSGGDEGAHSSEILDYYSAGDAMSTSKAYESPQCVLELAGAAARELGQAGGPLDHGYWEQRFAQKAGGRQQRSPGFYLQELARENLEEAWYERRTRERSLTPKSWEVQKQREEVRARSRRRRTRVDASKEEQAGRRHGFRQRRRSDVTLAMLNRAEGRAQRLKRSKSWESD